MQDRPCVRSVVCRGGIERLSRIRRERTGQLSEPGRQVRRGLRGGWADRCDCAHLQPAAHREMGPRRRGREPGRRGRQHRGAPGGQGGAQRLHRAGHHQRLRRQPDAQRQSGLRARYRLQDRGGGWHHAQRHRRQSWAQGLQSQGAGRAGEGREDDLRHAGRGHHAPPVGREVLQGARQGRRARRAVHGRRAAAERPRRRPCRCRLPCAAADHRAHQERADSKPWP